MRFVLLVSVALALVGCNSQSPYLPDGGRRLVNCTDVALKVPVTVLDRSGNPASGALVTATNQSDGRHEAPTTDGSGVATVSDVLAPGVVQVHATLNDLTSGEQDITFTCGDCDCSATPRELTLHLQ